MRRAVAIAFAVATFAAAPLAHADSLDGEWCSSDGRNLLIDGPNIRIPSGITITGVYRRHHFSYQAPAGDPEHGATVVMEQVSEEEMRLARVRDGVACLIEDWRRCNVTS